jgi:hypothetical protein
MKIGKSGHVNIGKSYAGLAQDSGDIEFGINTSDSDSSQFYSIGSLVIEY